MTTIESWRRVWREAAAPLLSMGQLEALRHALDTDDPRLIQGATTMPPPLNCVRDWPVEAACLIGYAAAAGLGWFATGLDGAPNPAAATVGDVEEVFAKACFAMDERMGEPAACRWLLNWFDDTPRQEMRRELLMEVLQALSERLHDEAGSTPAERESARRAAVQLKGGES